jgi:hypothetical protein
MPSTQPDRGRHDKCIDGELASSTGFGQQVASDAGDAQPGRDDPGVPATQLPVDRLVGSSTSVKLDQNRRGNPDLGAPALRRTKGGPDTLVALRRLPGSC